MRVVTDSYHHQVEASGKFGDGSVQRYLRPPSKDFPQTLQILVDFAFTGGTLNHDLDLLGIGDAAVAVIEPRSP